MRAILVSAAIVALLAVSAPATAEQGSIDGTQPVLAKADSTTCAVRESGLVYCWGRNDSGQLGRGSNDATTSVLPVMSLTGVISVVGNTNTFCALTEAHTVSCWGDNTYGTAADTPDAYVAEPISVSGLTNVASASVGPKTACAARQDGSVWCWGTTNRGVLGLAGTHVRVGPTKISALSGVVAVGVGNFFACALKVDHSVWCWGADDEYELGDGEPAADSAVPVRVSGITDAVAISISGNTACALRAGGTVRCWGYNELGQVGGGSFAYAIATPTTVRGLVGVTRVSVGANSVCAVASGETMCWGDDDSSQLGDGNSAGQPAPVLATAASTKAIAIAVGKTGACQVNLTRQITCWGPNGSGDAGDGTTTPAPNGTGPGNTFGRAANPTKVPILNSAPSTPVASSTKAKTAKVTWSAPSTSNGASAPKDYYVYYELKGSTTWKKFADTGDVDAQRHRHGPHERQVLPLQGGPRELGRRGNDVIHLGVRQVEVGAYGSRE